MDTAIGRNGALIRKGTRVVCDGSRYVVLAVDPRSNLIQLDRGTPAWQLANRCDLQPWESPGWSLRPSQPWNILSQ